MIEEMDESALQPPPPQLGRAQFIAMMECYRRLLFVWCIVPIALIAIPISSFAYLSLLEYWTGSAAVSTVLTAALTVAAFNFVRQYAPSEKAFYEGLERQGMRIFLCLFGVSCATTRLALAPLLRNIITANGRSLAPVTTWWGFLSVSSRLASGAALLGLAVIFRFIGPSSIVRCSTIPLVSHPWTVILRSSWARCTSAEALLNILAGGPSETPGELFHSAAWQKSGRRYQRPSLNASFAQILLSTALATAFSYVTIWRWFQTSFNIMSINSLICTSILSALLTLPLDGASHEINPKKYLSGSWFSSQDQALMLKTLVLVTVTAPLLSISIVCFVWRETPQPLPFLIVSSMVVAALVSLYVTFLDLFARQLLFTPGVKVKSLVENIYDEISLDCYLVVVLQSILYLDETLCQNLTKHTDRRANVVDIEQDEVKRNKVAMERMAHVLLNKDPYVVEAPLEEDMLRFLILESLGGKSIGASADLIGKRHMQNVVAWIQPKYLDGVKIRCEVEPPNVPLVRALCAVAGGLGEALIRVTIVATTLHSDSTRPSWILPPGAVACGEFAITAAARLIVVSLNLSERGMSDWRSSHLSVLVTTTLNAAFRLRLGVIKYASLRQKPPVKSLLSDDIAAQYEMTSPESLPLLVACDQAAVNILRTIKSFNGGRGSELKLDSDCLKWALQLLANDT